MNSKLIGIYILINLVLTYSLIVPFLFKLIPSDMGIFLGIVFLIINLYHLITLTKKILPLKNDIID